MKKTSIVGIILTAAMILSLTACNSEKKPDNTTVSTTAGTTQTNDTSETTGSESPSDTTVPEKEEINSGDITTAAPTVSGGWNGVFTDGAAYIFIQGGGTDIYVIDADGSPFSIDAMNEEVDGNHLHSEINIMTEEYEYYAKYDMVLNGDSLHFTHLYGLQDDVISDGDYTRTTNVPANIQAIRDEFYDR